MNVAEELGRFVICVGACFVTWLALGGLFQVLGINESMRFGQGLVFALLFGIPIYLITALRRLARARSRSGT